MARPQEQQVTQRRVINTIEDQNKYAMPDGRRLRVFADPLRMNVEAKQPSSVRLAEALAQVKPQVMDFLSDKASDDNAELFRQGSAMAMAGEDPTVAKAEWTKRGYESYKGYLEGERLSDELDTDWKMANKELGTDFDGWYQEWWAAKSEGLNMGSEVFRAKFDSAFMKGMATTKSKHIAEQGELQVQENESVIVGTIGSVIKELRQPPDGQPLDFSIYDVEALQKDMRMNLDGVSPQRLDELTYQTALMYAEENDDPEILETFKLKHSDGTPALSDKRLNDGSRWGEKINADIERITLREMQREDLLDKREKKVKEEQRFKQYSNFITSDDLSTDGINDLSKQMFKDGLFTSLSEASSEINQLFNLKKKEETQTQQLNTIEMIADINSGRIMDEQKVVAAFKAESISNAGAKEALSTIRQRKADLIREAKADARADKSDARAAASAGMLYKDKTYGIGESILKNAIVLPRINSNSSDEERAAYDQALNMKAEALRTYSSRAMKANGKEDFLNLANELVERHRATAQSRSTNVAPPAGIEGYGY